MRIKGLKITSIIMSSLVMLLLSQTLQAVTLKWEKAGDADLAGYFIYYGCESGVYTDTIDVGNTDSYTFTDLEKGRTYYFAVSSYDDWNNESDLSAEVCYTLSTSEETTDVDFGKGGAIDFSLEQNYPNPFNPTTTIRFSVDKPGYVTLAIIDSQGRVVRNLIEKDMSQPCREEVVWDGRDSEGREVASGLYFYRLSQADETMARRMVLVR